MRNQPLNMMMIRLVRETKRKLNPVRGAVIDVSGSVTATAFWGVIGIMVICFSIVAYFLFSMFSERRRGLKPS
ncbi:MAG: hypothetical protein IPG53_15710 [Ignavibacteriales bacterium]|nr:hypothetical protein [Ignavibacteriales bacterium]